MQQQLIQEIADEVRDKLLRRFFGKVFQLTPLSFAVDFGLRGEFLYVSADPASPRFYLVQRTVKELEKQSITTAHFGQLLKARLGGACLIEVSKDPNDRIVRLSFESEDEIGEVVSRQLIAQLTGKAANVLLLDASGSVTEVLRPPRGIGQTPGENYQPPPRTTNEPTDIAVKRSEPSPSRDADTYFKEFDGNRAFSERAGQLRAKLNAEIKRHQKLKQNLQQDLITHGEPDKHKRLGDLLLANVSTAKRVGSKVEITDYYQEGTPSINLEIDEATSLQDEAGRLFRQYTKAKRAKEEIGQRLKTLDSELELLQARAASLAQIVADQDEAALSRFDEAKNKSKSDRPAPQPENRIPGVRQYVSSDGYEIWIGRTARDNDNLTFRLAKPSDLWFHAGDYPGSHVVVRNPSRKEIPQRTVIEAAQLAGYFSQAREDSKVVVHYSERKFLAKLKGGAPGQVRMSRFRSITIEPKAPNAR